MKNLKYLLLLVLPLSVMAQTLPTDSVERVKMAKQLVRTIPMELGKIEGEMPQINMLIKQGEKVQARTMVEQALKQIAKIEADQKTLMQLDETVDDETLMTAELTEAKRYLTEKANKLSNAIGVYITCDAKLFDADNTAFLKELQGKLSQLGVAFVDSKEQADWAINIVADAREYNKVELGGAANYFVYVDAQLTIDKIANGKRVLEDAVSEKGGHPLNYRQAALEAYKQLVPRLSEAIKEQIEK